MTSESSSNVMAVLRKVRAGLEARGHPMSADDAFAAQLALVAHGDKACVCAWPDDPHTGVPVPGNVTMTAVCKRVELETDTKRVPQFIEKTEVTSTQPAGGMDHLERAVARAVDDCIADLIAEDLEGLDKRARGGANWIRDDNREHRRGWLYCDDVVVHVYHRKAGPAGRPTRHKTK